MKILKLIALIILPCLFGIGCGDGGVGSSNSETTVTSVQDQDNTQTLVPPGLEAQCNVACTLNPTTGAIFASRDCEGSAVVVSAVVTSTDECDSVTELQTSLDAEEPAPVILTERHLRQPGG